MLVLTRKVGEAIVIRGDMRVVVVAVRGSSVKLAIQAPEDVSIHRAEVAARIAAERKSA